MQEEIICELVGRIRAKLPQVGGKKLYKMLKGDLCALKIGRDKFFLVLKKNNLLIAAKKRFVKTTNSFHRFKVYNNLLKEKTILQPREALVADITYIRTSHGFCYLSLIMDVYSRKIVGYDLRKTLAIEGALSALKMALSHIDTTEGMIHHSDRGVQYCCKKYIALLKKNGIQISMSEKGNPYENAMAERLNGILKTEFYLGETFKDYNQALRAVKEAVQNYNKLRPHLSLNYQIPDLVFAA